MSTHDVDSYFNTVMDLVKKASVVVRDRIWDIKQDVQYKAHPTDFVTETDKYVEQLLIEGLKGKFPDHRFIGEESTAAGIKIEFTDDPTWIIDPVDGTLNFVHGYPNVCISIGLTINKELEIGIIDVPALQMTFTAIKGRGSFMNGKRISVSSVKCLKDALLTIECSWGHGGPERIEAIQNSFQVFVPKVHGIRAAGSAAFNLAMVALGASDGYYEIGIHAWDYAAGALLVIEAGGVVMDTEGNPLDLMSRRLLAASKESVAREMIPLIVQTYPTRDDA